MEKTDKQTGEIIETNKEEQSKELTVTGLLTRKEGLIKMAETYKQLEIVDVNDLVGFKIIDNARKGLKKARREIQIEAKSLKDEIKKIRNEEISKVASLENEMLEIIQPLELEMKEKQDVIKREKIRQERLVVLPERIKKLKEIGNVTPDDELLGMDIKTFNEYFNDMNALFLAEKARELKEAEEKLQKEKDIEAAKKQARLEAEQQAALEAERIKREAEEEKERLLKEAKEESEREKQAIINAQKEKERLAEEARLAKIKEKERAEKKKQEEKERAEKNEKYKQFLLDNNFDKSTMEVRQEGSTFEIWTLPVKISSITIK